MRVVVDCNVCGCSSVDRVLASEAKGRGFDPRQPHQINMLLEFRVLFGFAKTVLEFKADWRGARVAKGGRL